MIVSILNQLNWREQAILFWLIIAFILMFCRKWFRDSIYWVFKVLFEKVFIYYYLFFIIYVSSIMALLYNIWFLVDYIYKDLIFWIFWALFLTLYHIDKKYITFKKYLISKIIQLFSLSVLISFISNVYAFNFFIELFIQPLLFFITLLVAFSWNKKDYKDVYKFFNVFYWLIISILIYFIIISFINDFNKIINIESLHKYILSFVLSVLYFPFLFLFKVHLSYESLYKKVFNVSKLDKKILNKGFLEIVKYCKFRINIIDEFFEKKWTGVIFISNEKQLNEIINEIKSLG